MPKPSIEINKTEASTDSCHLRLSCEVKDQHVDYTWYESSGPFPKKSPGYVLDLIVTPQNKSTFYTCQVSNPVSSKNDTVYFTLPCDLGKNPGSWGGHKMTGFFRRKKGVRFLLHLLTENVVSSLKGVTDIRVTWLLLSDSTATYQQPAHLIFSKSWVLNNYRTVWDIRTARKVEKR